MAIVNPFEQANRSRRVAKLLMLVIPGSSAADNETLARVLEAATAEEREQFATRAGLATPPSDTTWAQLVAEVRGRPVGDGVSVITVPEARMAGGGR